MHNEIGDLLLNIFIENRYRIVEVIKDQILEEIVYATLEKIEYNGNYYEVKEFLKRKMNKEK